MKKKCKIYELLKMNSNQDKPYEQDEMCPKDKLEKILKGAKEILCHKHTSNALHPIFSYIKIFTDKITFSHVVELLSCEKNYTGQDSFNIYDVMISKSKMEEICLKESITYIEQSEEITISLSSNPIVVKPWKDDRLIMNITKDGWKDKSWKQDENHALTFCNPIGVCFITNGLHSVFTGKLLGEGSLTITPAETYNLIPFYRKIYFDGVDYRYLANEKIVAKASSFEFGCIFEIGRLIYKSKN